MNKKFAVLFILLMLTSNAWGENTDKLPIIYSKYYDISLFGLEKFHPFDTQKYGKVYKYLVNKVGINKNRFYAPEMVSEEDLILTPINKSVVLS